MRESGLVERQRPTEEQGAMALTAFRLGTEARSGHPIDRVARGTDDMERL